MFEDEGVEKHPVAAQEGNKSNPAESVAAEGEPGQTHSGTGSFMLYFYLMRRMKPVAISGYSINRIIN